MKQDTPATSVSAGENVTKTSSRRKFLKSSAYLGAVGASGVLGGLPLAPSASAQSTFQAASTNPSGQRRRAIQAAAYQDLLRAEQTGRASDWDQIPLDATATRRLANPQGAYRFIFAGLDGHATRMRPAPSFRSAESAAEVGEVYWQGLTRDVPFNHYDTDAGIGAALADLNGFSEAVGPKQGGLVTAGTIFRGPTPGDLNGPYISQFLWKDVPYGPSVIEQRYEKPLPVDFMVDESNWLNVQRGGAPAETLNFEPVFRYLHDNRGLGEYVHRDVLFQAYLNAGLILLGYGGAAIDSGNPYFNGNIDNQGAFTSLGGPYVIDLVTQAGNLGLNSAWYHKWLEHRRLRPEVFGGRVHFMKTGQRSYEIHPDLLDADCVAEAFSRSGTYFLPMGFTEGSPTHPSYPAGHATIAGACTTTLKTFFNEDFVIPDPVVSNDDGTALNPYGGSALTVGGELNKLASNISLGRDAAGVHYRSDGVDGMLVGEQQAISLLQDYSVALNEDFGGFSLTKFDGTRILIRGGNVEPN